MSEADGWHDYETNPPAAPDPAGEWIEVPIRGKVKGTGTVRGYVSRPPGRRFRIVCSGEVTVRDARAITLRILPQ